MLAGVQASSRRRSRTSALQILFQMDLAGQMRAGWAARAAAGDAVSRYFSVFAVPRDDDRGDVDLLVGGVASCLTALDGRLGEASRRWTLARMAAVDRNVLRLLLHEMDLGRVPREVGINEAVELARTFGSGDSAAFVNGILDQAAAPLTTAS